MECKKCIFWKQRRNQKNLPLYKDGKRGGFCKCVDKLTPHITVVVPEDFFCGLFKEESANLEKPPVKLYNIIVRPIESAIDNTNSLFISKSYNSLVTAKEKATKFTKKKNIKWRPICVDGRISFIYKDSKNIVKIQSN